MRPAAAKSKVSGKSRKRESLSASKKQLAVKSDERRRHRQEMKELRD